MGFARHPLTRSPQSAKAWIETHLRNDGEVYVGHGLTITEEQGRRRFFQICPGCSSTIGTDDMAIATFVQTYKCLKCRWKECDDDK